MLLLNVAFEQLGGERRPLIQDYLELAVSKSGWHSYRTDNVRTSSASRSKELLDIDTYCAYHINRDNSRRVLYSDEIRKVFFPVVARGVSRDQTRFFLFYGNISNLN